MEKDRKLMTKRGKKRRRQITTQGFQKTFNVIGTYKKNTGEIH